MSDWINFKEQTPALGQPILVWNSNGQEDASFPTCRIGKYELWKWDENGDYYLSNKHLGIITHWQPLPEPPKKEKE